MALGPGSQVGKYRLGRLLGEGGFGCVFAAHDDSLDRQVALKFLKAEHATTPEVVQRFLQEGRSAARIVHPGIVTIYECGELAHADADGVAYIAMELLDGESLTARLARAKRLAPATTLEIGRQLASALEAAHRGGVVHRDLKPDNIYLVPDGATVGGSRVKILDFGIAKLRDKTPSAVQTGSAIVFGTPRYMSPEQCVSAANVDHRSDIYTLGCILFELLAGRPPFDGTAGELVAFHLLMPPPELLSLAHDAPRALAALVEQMLSKEPADRPASMADVHRALEACGAVPAGQAPTLPPDGRLAVALPSDTMIEPRRTPTTLSGAAGASPVKTVAARSQWHIYAIAAALAVIVPIIIVAMLVRGGSDEAAKSDDTTAKPSGVATASSSAAGRAATRPPSGDRDDRPTGGTATRSTSGTTGPSTTGAEDGARRATSGDSPARDGAARASSDDAKRPGERRTSGDASRSNDSTRRASGDAGAKRLIDDATRATATGDAATRDDAAGAASAKPVGKPVARTAKTVGPIQTVPKATGKPAARPAQVAAPIERAEIRDDATAANKTPDPRDGTAPSATAAKKPDPRDGTIAPSSDARSSNGRDATINPFAPKKP